MSRSSFRSRAATLLFAVALAACGEETGPLPPAGPQPLTSGTYHMQTANSLELPAKIAERFISVTFEETILDESTLVIDVAGAQWSETYTTRVFHNALLDRTEVTVDEGTITQAGNTFVFSSTLRSREFTVTAASATAVRTVEPMVFFPGAIDVQGEYSTAAP